MAKATTARADKSTTDKSTGGKPGVGKSEAGTSDAKPASTKKKRKHLQSWSPEPDELGRRARAVVAQMREAVKELGQNLSREMFGEQGPEWGTWRWLQQTVLFLHSLSSRFRIR